MQLTHRPHKPQAKNRTEEYEEELEDWGAQTSELFEWVGLACLGSQRLEYSLYSFRCPTDAYSAIGCALTTASIHI